jgi:hypothetical protein
MLPVMRENTGALHVMAVMIAKVSLHMITGPGSNSFLMIVGSFDVVRKCWREWFCCLPGNIQQ